MSPALDDAISREDIFVIGPLPCGVDSDALKYLLSQSVSPTRITVFLGSSEDVTWADKFRALGVNLQVVNGKADERDFCHDTS